MKFKLKQSSQRYDFLYIQNIESIYIYIYIHDYNLFIHEE